MTAVGHIYEAIGEILRDLDVEKDGVLPGNMGGKAYRTIESVTKGLRSELVSKGVIIVPNEKVISQERWEFTKRMNFSTVIEGTYQLVSTKDGSSITISGTGRGNSMGTSVDANGASSFAFKNAVQRLFLISDNEEETAAMRDGTPGPTKLERDAAQARGAAPKRATRAKADPKEDKAKVEIKTEFIDSGIVSKEQVGAEFTKLRNSGDKTPYQTLLGLLEKGELTDA